ncbi:alpha/beta hydrolase [Rugamonas sp. CCM 8940]|uniref:alpha/beta hydrolase n=1 Tax=Rugamonas sp. CCM 8940 TaxID=2765359 RepID=UPI0018F55CBF|nr:alpha/beta hydrolase [Rugamonas sp. CCM 8940]MBJ7308854.1 alpha/beta hydrolase [Rugamonas sp. CCM 8940]
MKIPRRVWLAPLVLAFALAALLATWLNVAPLGLLNLLTPSEGSKRVAGLAYGPGPRHKLDIYMPARAGGKPQPVLLFFYGGNWRAGERADYAFVGRTLAARGIVVVVADYRLYPEVSYPVLLDDPAEALAWCLRHIGGYGGDPQRLFLMGHSAGAYNAAMLALDGRLLARHGVPATAVRGWIGLAGPYDFLPVENPAARPVFHYPHTPADSQPINHVSRAAPPALLIAARKDQLVNPRRNTGGLAYLLRARGVRVNEDYPSWVGHQTLVASLAAPTHWLAPTLEQVLHFVATDGERTPAPAAEHN